MVPYLHSIHVNKLVRQWFVYPDRQLMTVDMNKSMPNYNILMEMKDGRVMFMALAQRKLPTQLELERIAKAMSKCAGDRQSTGQIETWLCDEAKVVVQIKNDDIEGISSWTSALKTTYLDEIIRERKDASDGALRIRERIEQEWTARIEHFVDMLDKSVVRISRAAGGLFPAYYNYLAADDVIIRRNRCQASERFPLLLSQLTGSKTYGEIRDVIDGGAPLIEHLAEFHGVSKATVKSLAKLQVSFVAAEWKTRIGALLRLLGDIAPEHRPRNPQEWESFFQTAAFVAKISKMPASTTHNRLRLRASSRIRFKIPDGGFPDVEEVARTIDDLLDAIREGLVWEVENVMKRSVPDLLVHKLINQVKLSMGNLDKLQQLGRRYGEAFRREQMSFQKIDQEIILGIRWPSPLPDGLLCNRRIVVPLCTPGELLQEGRDMKNCVGGYSGRCLRGNSQLWSLRSDDGKPMSTLETAIVWKNGLMVPKIIQHGAVSNSKPAQECYEAAQQLLKALSRNHQSLGSYRKWKSTLSGLSKHRREMMVLTKPIIAALKVVLPGKISFESLVTKGQELVAESDRDKGT